MARFAFIALAFAAVQALAQAPAPAGTIDYADGDATVEGRSGAARLAKEGDAVREGETLTTFKGAEVHLKMADGAYLSVRENTKMTISRYRANGDDSDESLIELGRGALRAVTGWIGKYRREKVTVKTPMVTIGVRGTDYEVTHLLPGDPRGEPGSYNKVNEGATVMESPRGRVEIAPNRAAHFHTERTAAPRLLAEVPRFFQPSRNENRFVQRAQASERTFQSQRDERRKARGLPPGKPPAAERKAERKAERERRIEERRQQSPAAKMQRGNEPSKAAQMQRKAEPQRRPEKTERRFEKKSAERHDRKK